MSTASRSAGSVSQMSPATPSQRTEEAKDAFIASLNNAGTSIDAELQARAKNIHANAKALAKQDDDLRKDTKGLAKESDSLQKLLNKTKKEIQGFGDLESMMADLDADLAMIEETLRLVEEEDGDGLVEGHSSTN